MLVRVDLLDDRLEAIEADDDRERLRRYLDLWREGAVDPLRDPGTVLILELDAGPGRGAWWPTTAAAPRWGAVTSPPPPLVADQRGQRPRLPHPTLDFLGGRRAARQPLLPVVGGQAGVQPGRGPGRPAPARRARRGPRASGRTRCRSRPRAPGRRGGPARAAPRGRSRPRARAGPGPGPRPRRAGAGRRWRPGGA